MRSVESAIVISDLHLGREVSYLDSRSKYFNQNRDNLLEVLEEFRDVEEVVINGDLFEIALSGWNVVCEQANHFFDMLHEVIKPDRIVFIPGNHDHHLWYSLVEKVFVFDAIKEHKNIPDKYQYPFCFIDKLFTSRNPAHERYMILPECWPGKNKPEFIIKYPHHLLKIVQKNGERHYFFTHGHYLEPLFRPINYLIEPARIDELEGFNALWLESFNYQLGHASRLSEKVMAIITSYEQGYEKSKRKVKKILNEIFLNFQRKTRLGDIGSFLLRSAINIGLRHFPSKGGCALFKQALNKKLLNEIKFYLEKYILQRYVPDNYEKLALPSPKKIPLPFTFLFGHTHRPNFSLQFLSKSKITIDNYTIPVINTGGWLRIDSKMGRGENAGILLIDGNGEKWYSLAGKLR